MFTLREGPGFSTRGFDVPDDSVPGPGSDSEESDDDDDDEVLDYMDGVYLIYKNFTEDSFYVESVNDLIYPGQTIKSFYDGMKDGYDLFISRGISDAHIAGILCDFCNDRDFDIFRMRIVEYCDDIIGEIFDELESDAVMPKNEFFENVVIRYGVRLDLTCPRCCKWIKSETDHLKRDVVWDTMDEVRKMGGSAKYWTCERKRRRLA
jgi:hypothetical protein